MEADNNAVEFHLQCKGFKIETDYHQLGLFPSSDIKFIEICICMQYYKLTVSCDTFILELNHYYLSTVKLGIFSSPEPKMSL